MSTLHCAALRAQITREREREREGAEGGLPSGIQSDVKSPASSSSSSPPTSWWTKPPPSRPRPSSSPPLERGDLNDRKHASRITLHSDPRYSPKKSRRRRRQTYWATDRRKESPARKGYRYASPPERLVCDNRVIKNPHRVSGSIIHRFFVQHLRTTTDQTRQRTRAREGGRAAPHPPHFLPSIHHPCPNAVWFSR